MNFYWVNLGVSHKEVLDGNFLWAPTHTTTKSGAHITSPGWVAVSNVKKGDVIFCNANGKMIYVAVAKTDAYEAPRPASRKFNEWKATGNRIEVALHVLPSPIEHSVFKDEFFHRFNDKCEPNVFTKNITVAQTYMCSIPVSAGLSLQKLVSSYLGTYVEESIVYTDDSQAEGSNKEAVVKVRKGQAQFRTKVLTFWENTCPITGVSRPELLRASHIVPWSLSSAKEKVDPSNGLALSPSADLLFDRGYISIDQNGILISSGYLSDNELNNLGIKIGMKIDGLTQKHHEYLVRHRQLFDFKK